MWTAGEQHLHAARNVCSDLARCTQLTQLMLDELQELLSEPINQEDTRWIEASFDELCQPFDDEFQLQAEGGYLHEVIEEFPNWHRQVAQLKTEYVKLRDELRLLRTTFERPLGPKQIAQVVRQKFRDWFTRFSSHKRAENELILKAHTLDVGHGE